MVSDKTRVVLHIGYPKTGTTFLQTEVFPTIRNVTTLHGKDGERFPEYQEIIRTITDAERLEYDNGLRDEIKAKLNLLTHESSLLLVSEETFSTGSTLPGKVDRKTIALRLKRLFPEAEIFLSIRNQVDMAKSALLQQIKTGRSQFTSFGKWLASEKEIFGHCGFLQTLQYDRYISFLEDLFGKKKVHVFCYEMMDKDLSSYLNQLSELLNSEPIEVEKNIRVNPSMTTRRYISARILRDGGLRRLAMCLPTAVRDIGRRVISGGKPVEIEINKDEEAWFQEVYGDDNRRLAERYGLPLERFSYPMADKNTGTEYANS